MGAEKIVRAAGRTLCKVGYIAVAAGRMEAGTIGRIVVAAGGTQEKVG